MPIEVKPGLVIPDHELVFTASRSGGPGGQHANKTSSRITLYWAPASSSVLHPKDKERIQRRLSHRINSDGNIQLDVQSERSQHRNRALAEERLGELIRKALKRRKRRKKTKPTRGSIERRLKAKAIRAEKKKKRGPVKYKGKNY